MNTFLNGLKETSNLGYTTNGALSHNTTGSKVLDLFALGGSMRDATDQQILDLFRAAYAEDQLLALKCLFYQRDVREGQGQRRFFRLCIKDLAETHPEVVRKNLYLFPEYGRWDDLYAVAEIPELTADVFDLITNQLVMDLKSDTPSLLAKWLKSENASSEESKRLATLTRKQLGMKSKTYRKILSKLRERIKIVERLMCENRWNEIEFDKLPSVAGLKYRKAFANREETAEKYRNFMSDKTTKVNATVLNPYDITRQILCSNITADVAQKYWENLTDYFNGKSENSISIIDVSGSMDGTPLWAAVGMGAYIAERNAGPFKDHFITFSSRPRLVKIKGSDIVTKINGIQKSDWGFDTNLEAVFNLLLSVMKQKGVKPEDAPKKLYIFSDMQFNYAFNTSEESEVLTLIEQIDETWKELGFELPQIIFWNLNGGYSNSIPAIGGKFSYISGFSMVMIEQILGGKTGYELMLEKLNSERYDAITL